MFLVLAAVGTVFLLLVAPQQAQVHGSMRQQLLEMESAQPSSCTVRSRSLIPRCRDEAVCAEGKAVCQVTPAAGVACHCEVEVSTNVTSTLVKAGFDIGATIERKKNQSAWCRESLTTSARDSSGNMRFVTFATLSPMSQNRWQCRIRFSESHSLAHEVWMDLMSGTAPQCLVNPIPEVASDCIMLGDGRLLLGSKAAWTNLFAQVQCERTSPSESTRTLGIVLLSTAGAILLCVCGFFFVGSSGGLHARAKRIVSRPHHGEMEHSDYEGINVEDEAE